MGAIGTIRFFLQKAPNRDDHVWFQSLGGAVSRFLPRNTAFFHRGAIFVLQYSAQWDTGGEKGESISWAEGLRTAMLPYVKGTYVNFPDIYIPDWPLAYYGDNFNGIKENKKKIRPLQYIQLPAEHTLEGL